MLFLYCRVINDKEPKSIVVDSSVAANNDLSIQLSLPRLLQFSNGVAMLDCFEFRYYLSNASAQSLNTIAAQYKFLSTLYETTNSTCLQCSLARELD